MFQVLFLMICSLVVASHQSDPVTDQLPIFKNSTKGPIGTLTTSSGLPVPRSYAVSTLNADLNRNSYVMDTLSHFVRENIPDRIVHMKGAGALGYFETTHDISDICKAEFLNKVGKRTPLIARFSVGVTGKGGPDTTATPMGFAIRLYTQEGNYDLLGLNFPVFVLKDPIVFPYFIRVMKRNAATNVADVNMLWDFATKHPESLHMFLMIYGDCGIPYSYRHMPGYTIETFQVYNAQGKRSWIRYNFQPEAGVQCMNSTGAASTACSEPDYYSKDLYRNIANGNYPAWKVNVQVLSEEDLKNAKFDVFDTSKSLPEKLYPSRQIGRIVLDRNPENYFSQIEQIAFNPDNHVPGTQGSPSKVYEARAMYYRQAHAYRLGSNYNKIPVNCPYRCKVSTYNRDGLVTVDDNGGSSPNYHPNSFNGPEFTNEAVPKLKEIVQDEPNNSEQANEYYKLMPGDEQDRFVEAVTTSLSATTPEIQARAVKEFTKINEDLGKKVDAALKKKLAMTNSGLGKVAGAVKNTLSNIKSALPL